MEILGRVHVSARAHQREHRAMARGSVAVRAESRQANVRRDPVLVIAGSADGRVAKRYLVAFPDTLTIGRHETAGATWVVPDKLASSRHAIVRKVGSTFMLEDLESTNGTVVDG